MVLLLTAKLVLYYTGYSLGLLILALFLYAVVSHVKAQRELNYYVKQGFAMIPGGRTFFVGSAPLIKEWDRLRNSEEPYKNPI